MKPHAVRASALDGLLVIDLSQAAAGPICGTYLASLGAEVIKIERPEGGDMARRTPPYATRNGVAAQRQSPDDVSSTVLKRNRGKQSLALDLQTQEGQKLLHDLVRQADIVLENFRPGVSARIGADYATLKAIKPDLIYCSITGFGMTGPYSAWSAFDTIIQGMTGVMAVTGAPDGPPTRAGLVVADNVAPLFALTGILAALRVRDRTGEGDFVEVSMFDSLISMVWDEPIEHFANNRINMRTGNRFLRMAPWNSYAASDGYVVICAGQQDHWIKICKLIGQSELTEDARFATMEARLANVEALDAIVGRWVALHTRQEVVAQCQKAGVPCGPVNELPDLIADPHLAARELMKPLMHPLYGEIEGARVADFPVRFAETPPARTTPAPLLGQHTASILSKRLGLQPDQIKALVARGIIGPV